ncbi:unnamed protein product, partial [Polarella glacialis]
FSLPGSSLALLPSSAKSFEEMMARRNTGSLLVVALAACAIFFLLPAAETFLAPQALRGSSMPCSEANTLAQGSAYQAEARSSRVIVKATGDPPLVWPTTKQPADHNKL